MRTGECYGFLNSEAWSQSKRRANTSQLMNGRWFDERQLEAHISTGKEKFRRSDDKKAAVNFDDSESEEDEEERADKFGKFLEQGK
jgi:HIV Tat-specific factor 1